MITTKDLKEKYLKFFQSRGHKIIPSASLIPENDPTVLFTTAGMHPLVPYLLGEKHPAGDKLVNVQKCIRTSDIDEVGDDWHLTFFEMLGNWSFGSYWKKEAIEMSLEFLTKELGLDKKRISVSVFAGSSTGSEQIPRDLESAEIWKSLGIKKIKFLDKEDNFWGPAGKTGPCGPCTEMFYDGVEIWNDVFMEYNKTADGKYEPLKQKNVDTGMGVERTVAILTCLPAGRNNTKSVYEIEPLKSIIEAIKKMATDYDKKSERIIADHIRASVFIIADGVVPSNIEQGYTARRLIRRAIGHGQKIGIRKLFIYEIGKLVIDLMKNEWPELENNKDFIIKQLIQEENVFAKTLKRGLEELEKNITGRTAFNFFSTNGIPFELYLEELKNKGIKYDEEEITKGFQKEFAKHQQLSRTATAGKFKSGLADNSEQVTKLHTAAHLLLAALRKVLGEHVFQKGSNITAERLRLDFSHSEKVSKEQLKEIEDIVNEQIKKNLPIDCCEVPLDEARKMGAMGVFESKYGDKVKVYSIGSAPSNSSGQTFSLEICSGPHVQRTSQLGHFKILKEESSSAGVRRVKAVLK
ncbi:MAG TPA: alanine--tRNA ligase [Candidatus Paceibacterota bacterium]|nr:alanine--tRNA ligase [Candidatus Paceibacterota bacterium]